MTKETFREIILEMAKKIKSQVKTVRVRGSLGHLLFGDGPSYQSIIIKVGNELEKALNQFSTACGKKQHYLKDQLIEGKQIDSLFYASDENILEYDENKANAGLDSEKLPATIKKIKKMKEDLERITGKRTIAKIFHTSVFEEDDAPEFKSYYKRYRDGGVEVKFMKEYFQSNNVEIDKEYFYETWRLAGDILR